MAHQGPLSPQDASYKGSAWNLLIEWDGEEPTWEPLNIIGKDNPVSCAIYSEANNLLNRKGWKWLKRHAKNLPKIYARVQEAMKAKVLHGPKYKYGTRLPDREKTVINLDKENGNHAWCEANQTKLDLLDHFEAFEDRGEYTHEKAQELFKQGYQFIKMMMVYDVKHDGQFRAHLVASGNMTKADGTESYSSVVSL
jgi:hypothetical protein